MAERARVLLPLTDSPSVANVCCNLEQHRRMSQGVEGAAAPQTQAKPLFFEQKLNFSGRSQQSKIKKIFFYLLNEKKRNSFCRAR